MLGAAIFLGLWCVVFAVSLRQTGRRPVLSVVARQPHYIQLTAQLLLGGYWVYHVPALRAFIPLVIAQLLFAYSFSALLAWSRRDDFELGFGPWPITISISFFMIFKPEWFHWQFAVVALGWLVKEFVRWEKGGRSAHIFNPSSFPLAVVSLVLILTNSTDITFGRELATTLYTPPNIHWVIFLVALPGQFLFGVATMTVSAVLTTYLFGLGYFWATGTYFFYDAYLPVAVFLGMHLLFTDPSTSPRSESGRVVFGIIYGVGVIAIYAILLQNRIPTFYDKLLPVPIMNLMIQVIDRVSVSGLLGRLNPARFLPDGAPRRRYAITASAWLLVFVSLVGAKGVGDDHPGQFYPMWEAQCEMGSQRACDYVPIMLRDFCEKGSPWGCNALGVHFAVRDGDVESAVAALQQGCDTGSPAACENLGRMSAGIGDLTTSPPTIEDWPIIVRGSKGPVAERDPQALLALACSRGWEGTCGTRFRAP